MATGIGTRAGNRNADRHLRVDAGRQLGIGIAFLVARHRPGKPRPVEYAAAAASTAHTLQATSATAPAALPCP